MPNGERIWSTISRCWPVVMTRVATRGSAFRARITGSILMASGRVPSTMKTSGRSAKGQLPTHTPDADVGGALRRARVFLQGHDVVARADRLEDLADEVDLGLGRKIHPREKLELRDEVA